MYKYPVTGKVSTLKTIRGFGWTKHNRLICKMSQNWTVNMQNVTKKGLLICKMSQKWTKINKPAVL